MVNWSIDGTREYIKKKDEYTLNAALIIDLKPALGVVYAPAKNRLFFSYGKGLAFEIYDGEKKDLNCRKINNNEIIGIFRVRLFILVLKSLSTAKSPSVTGDLSDLNVIFTPWWLISFAISPAFKNVSMRFSAIFFKFKLSNFINSF